MSQQGGCLGGLDGGLFAEVGRRELCSRYFARWWLVMSTSVICLTHRAVLMQQEAVARIEEWLILGHTSRSGDW